MADAADFMMTAEELRARQMKRRRLTIVAAGIAALLLIGAFGGRPAMRAIKAFQARRHAARAFEFLEKEKWSEARMRSASSKIFSKTKR